MALAKQYPMTSMRNHMVNRKGSTQMDVLVRHLGAFEASL
jgi:hypothetical protein